MNATDFLCAVPFPKQQEDRALLAPIYIHIEPRLRSTVQQQHNTGQYSTVLLEGPSPDKTYCFLPLPTFF
jgi:hypothetical protein